MSIAKDVRYYLKNKPYIREALEKGIVNLSSLSRQIQKELGVDNFEAVKAAIRRSSDEMKKTREKMEEKVLNILKESKITIYDGDSVLITDKPLEIEDKFRVNLGRNYFYLAEKDKMPKKVDGIIRETENCTTIIVESSDKIEGVPGVVAFLTSMLSEQGVNMFEFISCWKYTIIVVHKKDALKAYEILSEITK
ncbi:hypothetical protein A3K63_02445 [Candidatus Micrarchaeota archaeon RBG_16_49_10]|nr:MAG: hypothetical protein A3K63_02445 [Candidatus Micrarchaeota archaeon RBG_16_49_10]